MNDMPIQYIQWREETGWYGAGSIEFYSYTPEEWENDQLLPNFRSASVVGQRPITREEFEKYMDSSSMPDGIIEIDW